MTVITDSERVRKAMDRAERIERLETRAATLAIELHAAAKFGETGRIALLIDHGAKVDARLPDRRTALHAAAVRGRAAAVEALLAAGADPDARDASGVTPLHLAAVSGDAATVLALVEAGAATAAQEAEGRTPSALLPDGVPERVRQALNPVGKPAGTKGETR